MTISRTLHAACSAALLTATLAAAGPAAAAGDFPAKPITLVVPFPAGGVIDTTGRMVADKLQALMNTSVLIDNRPGAGGTLGTALVARAPADGYTLLVGDAATLIYSPTIYKNARYDPVKNLVPVGQISYGPLVVLVGPKSQSRTMPELLAELKAGGNGIDYGSNGNGSTPHLATEMFKQVTGIKSSHIPFSGGPANMTALAGGEIAYSINHIPLALSIIATGRVKPLATTGAKRSPTFPDLPTLGELGVKDYEAYSWIGLFAPAGLPADVQEKLSQALQTALKDPALQKKMGALGDEALYRAPADFSKYIAAESARWVPLIRANGIAID